MNKRFLCLAYALLLLCGAFAACPRALAQMQTQPVSVPPSSQGYDVFVPIGKYFAKGDADALSAWFADNLDISLLSKGGDASRSQARQMLKTFFETYTPRSFVINHTTGRANMKYALADLVAGGETFRVTLFVTCKKETYRIQQLKIERL